MFVFIDDREKNKVLTALFCTYLVSLTTNDVNCTDEHIKTMRYPLLGCIYFTSLYFIFAYIVKNR